MRALTDVALESVQNNAVTELLKDGVKTFKEGGKTFILHKGEDLGFISAAKSSGWSPLDQARSQMSSLTEVSAGTVGLLTWTSAFNTIFNSFLLKRISDLNRKTTIANKLQLLAKWRADDGLIKRHIENGYKVVMSANQFFYVAHEYPDDAIIPLCSIGSHEKVFLCAGKYRHEGTLELGKLAHLKAEPGTELTIRLDHCDQAILASSDSSALSEISDLTINLAFPKRAHGDLIDFFQRIINRGWSFTRPLWTPNLIVSGTRRLGTFGNSSMTPGESNEDDKLVSLKRTMVMVPCYRHLAPSIGSLMAGTVAVKSILQLKKLGYSAPRLILATLMGTGLLTGYTFGSLQGSTSGMIRFDYDD